MQNTQYKNMQKHYTKVQTQDNQMQKTRQTSAKTNKQYNKMQTHSTTNVDKM